MKLRNDRGIVGGKGRTVPKNIETKLGVELRRQAHALPDLRLAQVCRNVIVEEAVFRQKNILSGLPPELVIHASLLPILNSQLDFAYNSLDVGLEERDHRCAHPLSQEFLRVKVAVESD